MRFLAIFSSTEEHSFLDNLDNNKATGIFMKYTVRIQQPKFNTSKKLT